MKSLIERFGATIDRELLAGPHAWLAAHPKIHLILIYILYALILVTTVGAGYSIYAQISAMGHPERHPLAKEGSESEKNNKR